MSVFLIQMKLASIFKTELKTGRHSMITHFLFLYANRIKICSHDDPWPHVALAVSRLDTLMCLITSMPLYWLFYLFFLLSPFTAAWHCSLACALAVLLAGSWEAARHVPGISTPHVLQPVPEREHPRPSPLGLALCSRAAQVREQSSTRELPWPPSPYFLCCEIFYLFIFQKIGWSEIFSLF